MRITELNLSNFSTHFLLENGYTTTESLSSEDFFSLSKSFPVSMVTSLVQELNHYGYLFPPNNEKTIDDYDMSTRLRNSLKRMDILYLSQLKAYTKEHILGFRNLGKSTFEELDILCVSNHFHYYTMPKIPSVIENNKLIYSDLTKIFAKVQLKSFEDFMALNLSELYHLSQNNYWLTAKIYFFFQTNNYFFLPSNDFYIFEYLKKNYTTALAQINCYTMHDLLAIDENFLEHFCRNHKLSLNIITKCKDNFLL